MMRPSLIVYLAAALAIIMNAGCATLPQDFDRPESYALTDTEDTAFDKARAKEKAAHRYLLTILMRAWWRPTPATNRARSNTRSTI